jgi:hypothetical protein
MPWNGHPLNPQWSRLEKEIWRFLVFSLAKWRITKKHCTKPLQEGNKKENFSTRCTQQQWMGETCTAYPIGAGNQGICGIMEEIGK